MNREEIDLELNQEYRSAVRGREYWMWLKEQCCLDEKTGLFVFPASDKELNQTALETLPWYLKKKYLNQAVIVTDQDAVIKQAESVMKEGTVFLEKIDRDQLNDLLSYYKLVQFHSAVVIISMEEPYGNPHIIGKAGITLNDYVKNALYV